MKVDKSIVINVIWALVALETIALFNGINGTLFTIVVAAIAGLGGWAVPTPKALTPQ